VTTEEKIQTEHDQAIAASLVETLCQAWVKWLEANLHIHDFQAGALQGASIFIAQFITSFRTLDAEQNQAVIDLMCRLIRVLTEHFYAEADKEAGCERS
jgi:hypothetical protein